MKQTYIYRIIDENGSPARYIYATNKVSAKRWQHENCPEIRAKFECIGIKKDPIDTYAREFSNVEYMAMRKHLADMTNPDLWKEFITAK